MGGAVVAAVATASVVPLVGTAEIVAAVIAGLAGVGGLGAAVRRRALDQLPLQVAPVLASWEGPLGRQLTARAWLGRGRRLDRVRFEVRGEQGPVDVLAYNGPVLGPFQGVFPAVDGPVTVVVRGESAGRELVVEREFQPGEQVEGRFHPAFAVRDGRWRWDRAHWSQVEGSR